MDLLKVPYQKRIRNKGNHNLATEVLKGFSPGVFNRLYVTHNKNLEQRKFRTKEPADPVGNYMFKFNNRNIRKRCDICSKLIIKTPERRHWRRSGVFILNFEHISHLVLVFLFYC